MFGGVLESWSPMTRKVVTAAVVASIALSTLGVAARVAAATTVLNGTIVSAEPVTLSPDAVAVVTLVDQTATPESGAIVGEQRIDGVASLPAAFEVLYDDARIDPSAFVRRHRLDRRRRQANGRRRSRYR